MFSYDFEIGSLLRTAKRHFFEINRDKDLTEADKKQLKDFYLQNMIAPRARKILEQHLAHEMQKDRVHQDDARRSSSPRRHAQLAAAKLQYAK